MTSLSKQMSREGILPIGTMNAERVWTCHWEPPVRVEEKDVVHCALCRKLGWGKAGGEVAWKGLTVIRYCASASGKVGRRLWKFGIKTYILPMGWFC